MNKPRARLNPNTALRALLIIGCCACTQANPAPTAPSSARANPPAPAVIAPAPNTSQASARVPTPNPRVAKLVRAAVQQYGQTVLYDPSYQRLAYPNGDVPRDRGVCSDVVIRALRGAGIDLQRLVFEDMRAHFSVYPHLWGLNRPDTNIDHRRVANLMTFFARHHKSQAISTTASAYQPGDIVAWRLPSGRLHIGVVTDQLEPSDQQPLLAHNIGAGVQLEAVLFAWSVIGHYRYF